LLLDQGLQWLALLCSQLLVLFCPVNTHRLGGFPHCSKYWESSLPYTPSLHGLAGMTVAHLDGLGLWYL